MVNHMRADGDRKEAPQQYPKSRGVAIYVVSCLFLWFFIAPIIAPTDVAPVGAPPVPAYLIAIQFIICYGVPLLFVYVDSRG